MSAQNPKRCLFDAFALPVFPAYPYLQRSYGNRFDPLQLLNFIQLTSRRTTKRDDLVAYLSIRSSRLGSEVFVVDAVQVSFGRLGGRAAAANVP